MSGSRFFRDPSPTSGFEASSGNPLMGNITEYYPNPNRLQYYWIRSPCQEISHIGVQMSLCKVFHEIYELHERETKQDL